MTDERPWVAWPEYAELLHTAGDPAPLAFWTDERDGALERLCARVWREALVYGTTLAEQQIVLTWKPQVEAVEAQRDRLAAALRQVTASAHNVGVVPIGGPHHGASFADDCTAHWCLKARAALADVPDDRARRRDEAYRAMVEALQQIARDGDICLDNVQRALALARQVEE